MAVEFLKHKDNVGTTRKGLPIEIYTEGSPHKLYFIALILQERIISGPTKKLVTSYMVRDLALLD